MYLNLDRLKFTPINMPLIIKEFFVIYKIIRLLVVSLSNHSRELEIKILKNAELFLQIFFSF